MPSELRAVRVRAIGGAMSDGDLGDVTGMLFVLFALVALVVLVVVIIERRWWRTTRLRWIERGTRRRMAWGKGKAASCQPHKYGRPPNVQPMMTDRAVLVSSWRPAADEASRRLAACGLFHTAIH